MIQTKRLNTRQLCFIIITLFSVSKFYVLPAYVSGISKEAGYLSVGLNFFIDFLLLLACVFIVKNKNGSLYETSISIFKKPLTDITFLLFAVYFLAKAFVPLLEQKNTISLTFYESQPTLLIFMPFFIVAFYIVKQGVNAFARDVELMLWVFGLAILIIFALSVPVGNYQSLLPLFQPINKVYNGAFNTLLWFGDPVVILFLGDYLTEKKNLYKRATFSFIISAVVTILLVAIFYAIFQSIAERQYYAPIKMSKYSITLSNIGRLDYFGSILFSLVSVYSITLPLLLACECINSVFKLKGGNFISPLIVTVCEAMLVYLFQNEIFTNVSFMQRYFMPFFLITAYFLPIVFAVAIKVKNTAFRRKNVQAR